MKRKAGLDLEQIWDDLKWFAKALALAPFALLLPRSDRKIVFGAWFGMQFADNPKYFLRYLLSVNSGMKIYWVGRGFLRHEVEALPGVVFLKRGSSRYYWHVLTARWACCCISVRLDIADIPTFGRMKVINLWHGIAFKGVRGEKSKGPTGRNVVSRALRTARIVADGWTNPENAYTSFSSEVSRDNQLKSLVRRFSKERSIVSGLSRNDYLIVNAANADLRKSLRRKYGELFGIPEDKRWYLYLPTFRQGLDVPYSFLESSRRDDFARILRKQGAMIVEKQHPQVLLAHGLGGRREGDMLAISLEDSRRTDLQELMLASDRLITDYSSCFFDFELMNRPVIHYAYDYRRYADVERGVEFELRDVCAGPVAETEEELLDCLSRTDEELLRGRGKDWRVPIAGETGHASADLAKWLGLVKGETIA